MGAACESEGAPFVSVSADRSSAKSGVGPVRGNLPDHPNADVAMTAHLVMDQAQLPPNRSISRLAAGRRFMAERAPLFHSSLGSAILLGLRFVQARLISVWGLLIAAAFCPPFVFAAFAVFSAAVNFASIASLLRLEAVFFQSADRGRLGLAFRLAAAVGVGFCGLAAGLLAGLAMSGWVAPAVAVLFLCSLSARAVLRLLWTEATAEGDFRAIGNSNVVQAVAQPLIMLILIGLFGPKALALFMADALGHVFAAAYLLRRRWSAVSGFVEPGLWSWQSLAVAAHRWRDAPRALLPSALLAYGFAIAPVLALPYAANAALAAQVALSMRLLEMPTQMFGTVTAPIALNRLRVHAGRDRHIAARIMALGLIGVAAALFGVIGIAGTLVEPLFEGTHWDSLGRVLALLTPFYAGIAVLTPLQEMATLSRQPVWQVVINAAALAAIIATMIAFGALSAGLLQAIGLISILRALAHTLFIWLHLGEGEPAPPDGLPASDAVR